MGSPGCDNSNRIKIEKKVPKSPERIPNKKYKIHIFMVC